MIIHLGLTELLMKSQHRCEHHNVTIFISNLIPVEFPKVQFLINAFPFHDIHYFSLLAEIEIFQREVKFSF